MRVWCVSRRHVERLGLILLCAAAATVLLRFPSAAANGVTRGLAVCGKQLIPSLFPFLVLTNFLIKSGIGADMAAGLARLVPPLRGHGQALTVWLLSAMGGYPTGACAVVGSVRQGTLSPADGRALLVGAVHAAPAFIIGGVGSGMLGSTHAGLLLWAAHLLASLLLWPLFRPLRATPSIARPHTLPLAHAITDSLHEAAATLMSMAGCVLASCTMLSVIDALGAAAIVSPLVRTLIAVPLEVCVGCIESAACGAHAPFFLGLALGWGGLSVIGQIAAVTGEWRMVNGRFFTARFLHGLLGGCLSLLLFSLFPPPITTIPTVAVLPSAASTETVVAPVVLILLMAVIFLMSLPDSHISRMGRAISS